MASNDLTSFLQTPEGKKYFSEISMISSRIRDFVDYQKRYPGAYLSKQNSLILLEDNPETTLRVYMFLDAVKCYKKIGVSIEYETINSLALSLFAMSVLGLPLWNLDYSMNTWLSRRRIIESFARNILSRYGYLISDTDTPQVFSALASSKIERANNYLHLLIDWNREITKYCNTQKANNYLQFLCHLSDHNTAPVVFPSIPAVAASDQSSTESVYQPSINVKPIDELNSLVGLSSVKKEINSFVNFIRVQQAREENGMKTSPISYHCIFAGNPGTGKTTVARIMASIYKELGIVKGGQLVETDRSGLVAEYIGQTAIKTNKIIDKAIGGVLFIDEAYALSQGGSNDFGKEAIATLIKRMEDDRGRLVVILAGYSDNMAKFLDANPGLQSRFSRVFNFADYSEQELMEIFLGLSQKYEYQITPKGTDALLRVIHQAYLNRGKSFGNARFVRNLFEQVIKNQADRIASESNFTPEMLRSISEVDFMR